MSLMRSVLLRASQSTWLEHQMRRRSFSKRAVRRFMPGEDVEAALSTSAELAAREISTVLTQLGEDIRDRAEAAAVTEHYQGVLNVIADRGLPIHLSVKPTQFGLDIDPGLCREQLASLARAAAAHGNTLWVDMEGSAQLDPTLELYRALRPEHPNLAICIQSYLRRSGDDLTTLLDLGAQIRLVKGAYAEPDSIAFSRKRDVDQTYFQLASRLVDDTHTGGRCHGIATHDLHLIDRIRAYAVSIGAERKGVEYQMLYGIRREVQQRMTADGYAIRVLISYGSAWFRWYMRRLAERPANLWFVARSVFN